MNIKKGLVVIGIGALLGNSIMMYITFLMAYFQGYRAVVLVNEFNEAHFEFFFIPISIIIGIWTLREFAHGKVRIGKGVKQCE